MITPTIVKMMEEEEEVITFDFEKVQTNDTSFWLKKYVNGQMVDFQFVYPSDLWREEA